ncbi:MAG: SURF1 family protein [Alphaproteobacteria bacterium]|nr:SURF1 family protein [Alphaproteobacteria bacterium]
MIRGFRPTFWPTLISLPAFLMLLGLGTWQMQRLAWKEGVIRAFSERVAADPLAAAPAAQPLEAIEYRRVRLSGRYVNDSEMFLAGRTFNGRGGWAILTPFRTDDGALVVVDRGWVPLDRKDPKTRPQSLIEGPTTVEGIVRRPNLRTYFTPENEPEKNLWFSADVEAMARKAGLGPVRPYLVEGLRQPIPGGFPVGGEIQVALRNDHLQYAITWYALAIALVVIYVLYHLKLEREGKRS